MLHLFGALFDYFCNMARYITFFLIDIKSEFKTPGQLPPRQSFPKRTKS